MFPSIAGLPAHPLIVHATVVLVPLAILAVLAVVVRPRLRARYGTPVLVVAALALVVAALAEESGQTFATQLPAKPLVSVHAQLGETLPPLMGLLVILLAGLLFMDRRARRAIDATGLDTAQVHAPAITDSAVAGSAAARSAATQARPASRVAPRRVATGVGALAMTIVIAVTALAGIVQVVRIGDSGARAAWGGIGAPGTFAPVSGAAATGAPAQPRQ